MIKVKKNLDKQAALLYNYGRINQITKPANAIIVLGSMDIRAASKSAELWHTNLAPFIVVSGGFGRLTPTTWHKSEASIFADTLKKLKVPFRYILIEDKSTNTPQNIEFSIATLRRANIKTNNIILVTLPFAERRLLATCQKQFSEYNLQITSANLDYNQYCSNGIDKNEVINLIVGEIERLEKYPKKGFVIESKIPSNIISAKNQLIELGYSKYAL